MAGPTRSQRGPGQLDGSAPIPVRQGAKALLVESGRALLVEEQHGDGTTFWTLPGGGVTASETARAGLRRELAEELNCRPDLEGAVDRFWYAHSGDHHVVTRYTVFGAHGVTEVTPSRREGILDAAWFGPADCPATTLPQVRYVLEDVLVGRTAPRLEAGAVAASATPGSPGR